MRGDIPWWKGSLLLAVYVLLSSALGLVARGLADGQSGDWARAFFVDVWSQSVDADMVFVAGTMVAGLASYRLAERRKVLPAIIAGFFLNWIVYWMSFLVLTNAGNPNAQASRDIVRDLRFVIDWGGLGLVFAATAPAIVYAHFSSGEPRQTRLAGA